MASRAPAQATPAPRQAEPSRPARIQTALALSQPGDAAEREAVTTARRVMAMRSVAAPAARNGGIARAPAIPIPRPAAPAAVTQTPTAETVSPAIESAVRQAAGLGAPLPQDVRRFMEPRFSTDFSRVGIHTDARAANLSTRLGARAFAYGRDIFFNAGQFQPDRPEGLELIAHELTHTVQQRDAVQRSGIGNPLDWIAERVNVVPGFRMLTLVLGVNPVNMRAVERSAANILRALVEFLPGGTLITEALDRYGIFDTVGNWIEGQFRGLGMVGSAFKAALDGFLSSLSPLDIFDIGGVWTRARRIFTDPVDRLLSFGRGLVGQILTFVRQAILMPLGRLAANTRGYDLLRAVLGEDPVTGEAVPRNAETLLGGFMKLIGQDELWQNIQRSGAIPRAWAWFQGALGGLMGLVRSIPGRFTALLQALEIVDLVIVTRALGKVASAFASFVGDFLSWGLGTVVNLLQIIVEVVAPGVMPYIRRAAGAFETILRNPVGFLRTLVSAAQLGFRQFAGNFLNHLRVSLVGWLTGAMSGAGIYIPQGFNLREILKFALSVMGLTWANIRGKLVRATNETVVRALETGFDIVRTLVTEGPAAAWQQIVESLTNLREMVIEQVMTFVRDRVVQAAVTRLLSLLSPVGAFIQAIIATYNTVMFFVERLRQIAQVAAAFIDSLATIAAGTIAPAATRVETTLAGLLTLAISFLARIAGLGRVSDAVTGVINRIRAPIDRALDRVVAWIVAQARRLGRFVAQAGVPHDPAERLRLAARAAVAAARRLTGRATAPLLEGILAAVRLRFGLTSITVFRRGATWWARATINPSLEQDLGVPTEAPATGGTQWDAAVAAVRADVARMEAEGVFETDLDRRLPEWIRRYGFRTLTVTAGEEDYIIQGTMNPAGPVARVHRSGSRGNPFRLAWPKPPSIGYPTLYFGGRIGVQRAQSTMRGMFTAGQNDSTGTPIRAYTPHGRQALPGGETIGLSGGYRVNVNTVVGPLSDDTTPGGGTILRALRPYGFDSTFEGLDGDHVREIQMGGIDALVNLWPLNFSQNRGAGATLRGAAVLYPTSGRSTTLTELKAKASARYYFRITSCA